MRAEPKWSITKVQGVAQELGDVVREPGECVSGHDQLGPAFGVVAVLSAGARRAREPHRRSREEVVGNVVWEGRSGHVRLPGGSEVCEHRKVLDIERGKRL